MLLLATVFLLEAVMGSLGFGLMGGGMKDVTGMDGASWEAKFHNADGQVCEYEELDYTFMGLGALNCGWNGKDARLQKKIWSSDQSGCARACRKLQWCNYAWSDSGVTKLFNKGAGWCYMYNTCNERTGTEEGRLLKKKCPQTPTLPCSSSCSTYKSQWTIDGDCDAGDCLGCDFYWKGNKFDNGACEQDEIDNAKASTGKSLAYATASSPARTITVVNIFAAVGLCFTVYGAYKHYSK